MKRAGFKRVPDIAKSDYSLRYVGSSGRPSAWSSSARPGRIFMKVYI